jgi:hypothetical protein
MSITIFFKLFLKIWAFPWIERGPPLWHANPVQNRVRFLDERDRAGQPCASSRMQMAWTELHGWGAGWPPHPIRDGDLAAFRVWPRGARYNRTPLRSRPRAFVQEVATAERDHASRGDSAVPRPASTAPDPTCWHEHRGFSAAWITL